MKVIYQDVTLAESNNTEVVEGNHYFPRSDVKMDLFTKSTKEYTCPWKGEATYYHVEVNGQRLENIAWSYEDPKEKAKQIAGHICFEKKLVTE
ncbi:uncharacterized protein (DUF427 family) [Streptohalobacillus salinus]|uniref:Uncharacterized protein (DUF427 family) n=1 Tax=Streptohalobacillus salinus TaxID=621096 RepID=A0A2V3WBW1_9BACI|nr:DUF427 domain-containing protein [Streptohalobacillus salinus]PXW91026.1 uncharacterized protein (DUF427 family) [Streptohalobacillus salinus]